MSILQRVVLLTILYEIPVVWVFISGVILDAMNSESNRDTLITHDNKVIIAAGLYRTSWLLASIVINLSIFLMQQHNSKEYEKFLRMVYKCKLYHVFCCCCKRIFIDAGEKMEMDLRTSEFLGRKQKSTMDTGTLSVKSKHSVVDNLSVVTATRNELVPMHITDNKE